MTAEETLIILIATNVSEQMGGEGVKALQIFRELRKAHKHVIQVTHARNRAEISGRLELEGVVFVEDTALFKILWKSVLLRWLLDPLFSRRAVALAETIANKHAAFASVILHQTEPNSPVVRRTLSKHHLNVFGPINGNIYYPKAFRSHESFLARLRRTLHFPLQGLNRVLPGSIKHADLILYAGGERTRTSLLAAGCRKETLRDSADCGVPDSLLGRPRIGHRGANYRFVHFGRLVFHKGTFLIIESLVKTRSEIHLDIIGRGPELDRCRQLAGSLKLGERVRFRDWYTDHGQLLDALGSYRGVVLPSIEDANGIVVQEAMALGLPPICLDWGGPQLLIENGKSGYLVPPTSRERITDQIALHLDSLANDGELAESMSIAARKRATEWRWPTIIEGWLQAYSLARAARQASGHGSLRLS